MIECGHVFCVQCLQDFYNSAITEGDLTSVKCLAPNCAKERNATKSRKRKPKLRCLKPSELLQIPIDQEMVKRFVRLKHKADLESDKDTVYCPRQWCQGAARSTKYKKPEGFETFQSSDSESDGEYPVSYTQNTEEKYLPPPSERIAICEDCTFAFCRVCLQGWHGEYARCWPQTEAKLSADDKASIEYMKLHTTPCPTCNAPAQKTHGCNHMICFKCNSHFCYLCSAWLLPDDPYKHFNSKTTGCYQRLWELEGGDGDDVGHGYAGGGQAFEEELERIRAEDAEILEDERAAGRGAAVAAPVPDAPAAAPVAQAPARHVPPAAAPMAGLPRHQADMRAHDPAQQEGLEAGNRAWIQDFVQMALNDNV